MYGYFCIGFIEVMLKGKSLLEYTNLFSLNDYEKNYTILKYSQQNRNKLKCIVKFVTNIENLKNLTYIIYSLSIVYSKCDHENKKRFKEEESIKILKILGLVNNIEEYQKINNHA